MFGLKMFFRCIGEAVCAKGLKALACLIPFGEATYEIAEETYRRMRLCMRQDQEVAAIAAAASATPEDAKREAEQAVREIAEQQNLSPEIQLNLVSYLTQVPSAVRQTMKRPSDPAGKTVPGSFTLQRAEQLVTMLPPRLPAFKAGDRPAGVNNWELVELLGAGGFGEVWLARHPTLHGVTAALKFCLDQQAASVLRHEANLLDRVMRQSRHPGIVTLRQAYLDATPLCLEYEYVNGGDLAALLGEWQRGGKVPRHQVNVLMLRLSEIVAHAHKLSPPIVHRDLKPANILIERGGDGKVRLKVADFGIGGVAATKSIEATRRGKTGHNETLATSLRGSHTPIYASPQQQRGEAPDPRDDVHALGVIWYQLLTGDLTTGIPADWMTVLEDLGQPVGLIKLLGSCVSSRPEKRLADASELVQRLEAEMNAARILEAVAVPEPEPVEKVAPIREVVPPPMTQKGLPPVTKRIPVAELAETLPVAEEAPLSVVPVAALASVPSTSPSHTPRPGNQYRRYVAAGLSVPDLMRDVENWLRAEGFNYQDLKTEDGGTLIQIERQGGWRKFVGMSTALNIFLVKKGDELNVEIGAGQWLDKAAAGVVSLFILWPLAVTAAIGAWNQMRMPERVFSHIAEYVSKQQSKPVPAVPVTQPGGLSPEKIAQLKDLASLRDQGILTDEEFQAEKARLLGRG